MARRYVNPAGSVTPVTDQLLDEARIRADAATARLAEAEHANPALPGWDAEYEAATAAVRSTSRRVEGLERLRAAQIERSGKRDATAKAAAGDLKSIASGLAATRDAVAAAAAAHLKSLAALAMAVEGHNARLAEGRALLAAKGLQVRDDLADEGHEHGEGTLERGLRAGGIDWIPCRALGLADHALLQVFKDPQTQARRFRWRSFEVGERADGLKVPTLADVGAILPPDPSPAAMPARLTVAETVARPPESLPGGYYRDPPPRRLRDRTVAAR